MTATILRPHRARVDAADWDAVARGLDEVGCGLTGNGLLDADDAAALIERYRDDTAFRSTVDMERYRFGAGEYRYFAAPLPPVVDELRRALFPHLLPIAREWYERIGRTAPWPDDFDEWIERGHAGGQTKPTPLLLKYGPGDWNALHRDLYGDHVFPLQVVINLTRSDVDYTGGEFLLVEQRPRAQSRGTSVVLPFGEGLVFTTRDRPVRTARGWSAAPVRHGVSVVRSGQRYTLGILFHDAA